MKRGWGRGLGKARHEEGLGLGKADALNAPASGEAPPEKREDRKRQAKARFFAQIRQKN